MRPVARDVRPSPPSVRAVAGAVVLLLWMAAGPVAAPAQLSELFVETNVPDAVVEVDGEQVGQTNEEGQVLIEGLRPGTYTVEVRHPGYWTASTRTTLEPDLTSRVSLTLTSRPGEGSTLLVETNVPAAVVEVDGEQVGQTGPDGRAYARGLIPGTHRVVVRKSGYQPARRTVTFDEAGLDRTIQLRLLPGGPTVADSAVPPPDTGEAAALTAEADEPARPDTAALASPDTAARDTTALDTTALDTTARARTAAPAPSRLLVDAGVAGARVVVGDSVYGRTGPDGRLAVQARPGTHEVRVRKEGFQPVQTVAQLVAGEALSLSLPLSRAPTASDPLSEMSDNVLVLFLAALAGLTGIVAGVAGWKRGVFTRWLRGGTRFDRYTLFEELRRGEFTTTHRASGPSGHAPHALETLNDPYAGRPDHAQQFLQKGRTLRDLPARDRDVPVLEVYRVGREDDAPEGRPFIAHEHLEGDTLPSHLEEAGRLDTATALSVVRQVCVGLRALHEAGTHHGALTPENIVVTQTDPTLRVTIVGFWVQIIGFTRKERSMPILGASTEGGPTAYVAPEQLQNGRGGPASDLYAAGILFYTLVTGSPPYAGDDPARLAKRLAQEPPELPDHIPDHVTPMFSRMLSPTPDRRPTADRVVSVLGLIETTA